MINRKVSEQTGAQYPHEAQPERNEQIFEDWVGGLTMSRLSKQHRVSLTRIRQIIWNKLQREYGLPAYSQVPCLYSWYQKRVEQMKKEEAYDRHIEAMHGMRP